MRRIVFILVAAAACCLLACAQKQGTKAEGDVLVAYFSATGTTRAAAQKIAEATDGTLYEIRPVEAYTAADLDWHDDASRSSVEMNDPGARPAIVADSVDVASYDVIYLGFPIWWGVAPRVVNTFVEHYGLKGKTVVPFATSGGSGIAKAVDALQAAYPAVNWQKGRLMNGMDREDVDKWIKNK